MVQNPRFTRRQLMLKIFPAGTACLGCMPPPAAFFSQTAQAAAGEETSTLNLTLSCGDYDRTQPLITGAVKPERIGLKITCLPSPERHHRMLVNREFDICELSLSSYLIGREQGIPLTALPIIPHRRFRHGYIFINKASGILKPQDLAGKRVGVRRYQNTASVWVRGMLADDYGVNRRSVRWFTEGDEELEVTLPSDLSCTRIAKGSTLDGLLAAGQLDAVIYPEELPSITKSSGQITRLFPDYKRVEMEYFKRTGIFPPMHTVVVKNEILERHPWVAASLWKAFQAAKAACYQYYSDQRRSSLAWFGHAWEEQQAVLGKDAWPHNLEENRKALETLCRYLKEDGLIAKVPDLGARFLPLAT